MEKKVIIAAVENFSGFLITTFVDSESHQDLEAGIISTVMPLKSAYMLNIRVDQAPGFSKLKNKPKANNLSSLGIEINLGDAKNKNSLAIVDQRMKELEEELRKDNFRKPPAESMRKSGRNI